MSPPCQAFLLQLKFAQPSKNSVNNFSLQTPFEEAKQSANNAIAVRGLSKLCDIVGQEQKTAVAELTTILQMVNHGAP